MLILPTEFIRLCKNMLENETLCLTTKLAIELVVKCVESEIVGKMPNFDQTLQELIDEVENEKSKT